MVPDKRILNYGRYTPTPFRFDFLHSLRIECAKYSIVLDMPEDRRDIHVTLDPHFGLVAILRFWIASEAVGHALAGRTCELVQQFYVRSTWRYNPGPHSLFVENVISELRRSGTAKTGIVVRP
jgi:hypothetical protein